MAQVIVEIGGRNYPLSCRDGGEPHLLALAADLAAKASKLTGSLGPMSEARLLLMTALMVADELHDSRAGLTPPPSSAQPALEARLAGLLERVEQLAVQLEKAPRAA